MDPSSVSQAVTLEDLIPTTQAGSNAVSPAVSQAVTLQNLSPAIQAVTQAVSQAVSQAVTLKNLSPATPVTLCLASREASREDLQDLQVQEKTGTFQPRWTPILNRPSIRS